MRSIARAITSGAYEFDWDGELKGFDAKATPKSNASYVVQKQKGGRGARPRWLKIGEHGTLFTPKQAREEAARLLRVIATGGDPAAARRAEKKTPTVTDFAERFLSEHVATKCKPSTTIEYRSILNTAILPAIGKRKLSDVTHADAVRLHHMMAATPYAANFAVAVARKMFNLSELWGERSLICIDTTCPHCGVASIG
jgi:hypothetical protein